MKQIVIFFFIFLFPFGSIADHIIGGDIYYDDLGGGNYKFYITIYRDCNAEGAWFDDPLKLTVYNNGSLVVNMNVPFPGFVTIPVDFDNPCATAPTNVCVQRAIYQTTLQLPPIVGGYTISYQRCCRGPNVDNIVNPDDTGLTLTTQIPGSETGHSNNSSPRFINYPPILLCAGEELSIDHSAIDPDGDELVYSLVSPYVGGNSFDPAPNQADPPPYFPVQWIGGFNSENPLGPGSNSTIEPDGMLTVSPNIIGLFVFGVRVQEFRDGELIGETIRDFLFKVFDCNITMQAILPQQEELSSFISYCQGLTVEFENNSYGGTNYLWDFGVSGISTDFSTQESPIYTYQEPGEYIAQLIVNPGWDCTDTAYMSIVINNPFSLFWEAEDSLCIVGNSFDFTGVTNSADAIFEWVLDGDASITNWSGLDIPDVSFSTAGYHTVLINGDDGECQNSFEDSVYVVSMPNVEAVVPDNVECLGFTIDFDGIYSGVSTIQWDFGDEGSSDVSSLPNPSYTYTAPGIYSVELIGSSVPNCSDTNTVQIEVKEKIILDMMHNDSLCITDGFYNFEAIIEGPPGTLCEWNFGPNASLTGSTDLIVSNIQFNQPGHQEIRLTGSHEDCIDSLIELVYVYAEPTIDFSYMDGLQCAPVQTQFINLSLVDGSAIYLWDFGDGSGSTDENPFHVYSDVGDYSVGLTVISSEGCVDTLYLMKQDLFTVYPSPTAGFFLNPTQIDICENDVEFIDQSTGATDYFYFFDQNQFTSSEANFTHQYINSGSDYPMQVVYNNYGCSDSVRLELFVEPFALYIPNAFIPDEDGCNDVFKAVTGFEIVEWEMVIYNKWGEEVYRTNDFDEGWDGNYQNNPVQDGVYTYFLKYKSCANPYNTKMKTGIVNLIR